MMRRLGAAAAALLFVASCAPRLATPPQLDAGSVRQRFERGAAQRDALGAGVEGEARIWVSGSALRDLPGMSASLLLAAPDAVRMRVQSVFGTALDVSVRGDSLRALIPARRVAFDLANASDTLGIPVPGPFAYRVWSATWRPPGEAWRTATAQDSLVHLRWVEAGDSLEATIGASGLPRRMAIARPDGTRITWAYAGWDWIDRVPWPSRLDIRDGAGTLEVRCRLTQLKASRSPSRARFAIRLPDGVERISWYELRRSLESMEEP